jgi:hypothetical protein
MKKIIIVPERPVLRSGQKIYLKLVCVLPCGITVTGTWNVPGTTPGQISANVGALGLSLENLFCGSPSYES